MANPPGHSRASKTVSSTSKKVPQTHQALSRVKALRRAARLLNQETALLTEALQLINRFRFHPDELTEAGVTYEVVRALEHHHPLVLGGD